MNTEAVPGLLDLGLGMGDSPRRVDGDVRVSQLVFLGGLGTDTQFGVCPAQTAFIYQACDLLVSRTNRNPHLMTCRSGPIRSI